MLLPVNSADQTSASPGRNGEPVNARKQCANAIDKCETAFPRKLLQGRGIGPHETDGPERGKAGNGGETFAKIAHQEGERLA